jgi:type IV secretion system protein VirB5
MQKIKRAVAAVCVAATMSITAAPARAGVPVIDIANLVEAIQQVLSWYQQYQQMVDQYNKLQDQYNQAVTMTSKLDGARSLGSILNNTGITNALPAEMRNSVQVLSGAYGSSTGQISAVLSQYGVNSSTSSIQSAADTLQKMQQVLSSSQQRNTQLTQLASRVDGATDAKESTDLVSRNVIEGSRVNNDLMQTIASIEANRRATELRDQAQQEASLSAASTVLRAERAALGF